MVTITTTPWLLYYNHSYHCNHNYYHWIERDVIISMVMIIILHVKQFDIFLVETKHFCFTYKDKSNNILWCVMSIEPFYTKLRYTHFRYNICICYLCFYR